MRLAAPTFDPVTLLSLTVRTLITHLLLIIWYLQLFLAFAGHLSLPVLPVIALPLMALLGLTVWVSYRYYYPPRKVLVVHLFAGVAGLMALWLHLWLIPVVYGLTLAAIAYPCRQCIRLALPVFCMEPDE